MVRPEGTKDSKQRDPSPLEIRRAEDQKRKGAGSTKSEPQGSLPLITVFEAEAEDDDTLPNSKKGKTKATTIRLFG